MGLQCPLIRMGEYVSAAIKDGNPILQLYFIEKLHLDGNPGAFFMLFPVIILHSFKVFRKCYFKI